MSDFEKRLHSKNHILVLFTPWNWHTLHFFVFSMRSMILNWKFWNVSDFELRKRQCVRIWMKKNNASGFEWKSLQRFRFWIEKNTTRKNLKWKNYIALDFELKLLQRVIFENKVYTTCQKWKNNLQHARFGLKIFATRQILKWKFYIALHFGLKVLQRVRF